MLRKVPDQRQQVAEQIENNGRSLGKVLSKNAKVINTNQPSAIPDGGQSKSFTWKKRIFYKSYSTDYYSIGDMDFSYWVSVGNDYTSTLFVTQDGTINEFNIPQYSNIAYDIEVYRKSPISITIPIQCTRSLAVEVDDVVIFDSGDSSPNMSDSVTINIPGQKWTRITVYFYTGFARTDDNYLKFGSLFTNIIEQSRIPVPPAPISIGASQGEFVDAIRVDWSVENQSVCEFFQVWYSESSDGSYRIANSAIHGDQLTYLHAGLAENSHYWYKVRGVTSDGDVTDFIGPVEGYTKLTGGSNRLTIEFGPNVTFPDDIECNGYYKLGEDISLTVKSSTDFDATDSPYVKFVQISGNTNQLLSYDPSFATYVNDWADLTSRISDSEFEYTIEHSYLDSIMGGRIDVYVYDEVANCSINVDNTGITRVDDPVLDYVYNVGDVISGYDIEPYIYYDNSDNIYGKYLDINLDVSITGYESGIFHELLYEVYIGEFDIDNTTCSVIKRDRLLYIDNNSIPSMAQFKLHTNIQLDTYSKVGFIIIPRTDADIVLYASGTCNSFFSNAVASGYCVVDANSPNFSFAIDGDGILGRQEDPYTNVSGVYLVVKSGTSDPLTSSFYYSDATRYSSGLHKLKFTSRDAPMLWNSATYFDYLANTPYTWNLSMPYGMAVPETGYNITVYGRIYDRAGNYYLASDSIFYATGGTICVTGVHSYYKTNYDLITVSWDALTQPEIAGYYIYKQESAIGTTPAETLSPYTSIDYPTANYLRDQWGNGTNIKQDTEYSYWVKAYNKIGLVSTGFSPRISGYLCDTKPPEDLCLSIVGENRGFTMTWKPSQKFNPGNSPDGRWPMEHLIYRIQGSDADFANTTGGAVHVGTVKDTYGGNPSVDYSFQFTDSPPSSVNYYKYFSLARNKYGYMSTGDTSAFPGGSFTTGDKIVGSIVGTLLAPSFVITNNKCRSDFGLNHLTIVGQSTTEGFLAGYKFYRDTVFNSSFPESTTIIGVVSDTNADGGTEIAFNDMNIEAGAEYYYAARAFSIYGDIGPSGILPIPPAPLIGQYNYARLFTNYLDNSSFERDFDSDLNWYGGTIYDTLSYIGKKSVVPYPDPLLYNGYIFVQPSNNYSLSLYAKNTSSTPSLITGGLAIYEPGRNQIAMSGFSLTIPGDTDWTRMCVSGDQSFWSTTSGTSASLFIKASATTTYIDAVQLEKGIEVTPYTDSRVMSADRMSAHIICGDMLQAGAITADKIKAREITSELISSHSITADHLNFSIDPSLVNLVADPYMQTTTISNDGNKYVRYNDKWTYVPASISQIFWSFDGFSGTDLPLFTENSFIAGNYQVTSYLQTKNKIFIDPTKNYTLGFWVKYVESYNTLHRPNITIYQYSSMATDATQYAGISVFTFGEQMDLATNSWHLLSRTILSDEFNPLCNAISIRVTHETSPPTDPNGTNYTRYGGLVMVQGDLIENKKYNDSDSTITAIDGFSIKTGTISADRLELTNYVQIGTTVDDINSLPIDEQDMTTIHGGHIRTNTISGNKLVANSINTNHLAVTPNNMIEDSTFAGACLEYTPRTITEDSVLNYSIPGWQFGFGAISPYFFDIMDLTSYGISCRISRDMAHIKYQDMGILLTIPYNYSNLTGMKTRNRITVSYGITYTIGFWSNTVCDDPTRANRAIIIEEYRHDIDDTIDNVCYNVESPPFQTNATWHWYSCTYTPAHNLINGVRLRFYGNYSSYKSASQWSFGYCCMSQGTSIYQDPVSNHATIINGDYIKTGTIDADKIRVSTKSNDLVLCSGYISSTFMQNAGLVASGNLVIAGGDIYNLVYGYNDVAANSTLYKVPKRMFQFVSSGFVNQKLHFEDYMGLVDFKNPPIVDILPLQNCEYSVDAPEHEDKAIYINFTVFSLLHCISNRSNSSRSDNYFKHLYVGCDNSLNLHDANTPSPAIGTYLQIVNSSSMPTLNYSTGFHTVSEWNAANVAIANTVANHSMDAMMFIRYRFKITGFAPGVTLSRNSPCKITVRAFYGNRYSNTSYCIRYPQDTFVLEPCVYREFTFDKSAVSRMFRVGSTNESYAINDEITMAFTIQNSNQQLCTNNTSNTIMLAVYSKELTGSFCFTSVLCGHVGLVLSPVYDYLYGMQYPFKYTVTEA